MSQIPSFKQACPHRHQKRVPLKSRYFTAVGSSSVKTAVDRHKLPAYRNENCWRSFMWCQHWWPWTTLKP